MRASAAAATTGDDTSLSWPPVILSVCLLLAAAAGVTSASVLPHVIDSSQVALQPTPWTPRVPSLPQAAATEARRSKRATLKVKEELDVFEDSGLGLEEKKSGAKGDEEERQKSRQIHRGKLPIFPAFVAEN